MYAVIESGGKQHRVVTGETLKLEKLDVEAGKKVKFDKVMLVANGDDIQIGTPYVKGAKVSAEVLSHGRADKIKVIKFNRRKNYRPQAGHRSRHTEIGRTCAFGHCPRFRTRPIR